MHISNFTIYPENMAETTLTSAISTGSTSLTVADGSVFPQSDFGVATTGGSNTILNTTISGVNGRSAQVGDWITNWTDGSNAVIADISAGVITTSCLKGGVSNVWNLGDEWSVRPFGLTLNKRALDVSNHLQITARENVLVKWRDGNTLYIHIRGWNDTSFSGSIPTAFSVGDYASIFDMAQYTREIDKRVANLEAGKFDICGCTSDLNFCGVMNFGEDCDGNACSGSITGLTPNPSDPTAPVTNEQFTDFINSISSVILTIYDNDGCAPHHLSWVGGLSAASAPGSVYRIKRNGVIQTTQTYAYTTWVDYSPSTTADNVYIVEQYDAGTGQITQSNQITMVATTCYNLLCGYFGDGANGILSTGGTTIRNVFRYSSINLVSQTLTISGGAGGPMIWLVDGNVNIQSSTINSSGIANSGFQNITIHGQPTISGICGQGMHGSGGNGGIAYVGANPLGAPSLGGNGTLFTALTNSSAFGGNNGWANPYGQNGHDSAVNKTFAAGGGGGYSAGSPAIGGLGGVGGTLSGFQPPLIIVCKGNLTITGSTINGVGVNGGVGGPGSIGGYNGVGVRWGGSGGGGGGAGGSDGMKTYVYHLGTQSGTPTYNANGGLGGNGGVSNPYPGNPGTAGTSGTNGNTGVAGTFSKIQLTC